MKISLTIHPEINLYVQKNQNWNETDKTSTQLSLTISILIFRFWSNS